MRKFPKVYYLTFICRSAYFGRLHAHRQELTPALAVFGFTLERGGSTATGGSSAVGRGLARPRPTTLLSPRSKAKPEAVGAVVSS
jgi:hypothetical protein